MIGLVPHQPALSAVVLQVMAAVAEAAEAVVVGAYLDLQRQQPLPQTTPRLNSQVCSQVGCHS